MIKKLPVKLVVMATFFAALNVFGANIVDIIEVGAEEYVGSDGRLVHIATDSKNQPHIIADIGGSNLNYFYDRVNGTWRSYRFDSGGESHQAYNPHIEINSSDQAWYSVVKGYSHGMGVMHRNNMATAPAGILRYSATSGGMGGLPVSNLGIDINSNNRCIVYGGNGGWYDKVLWNGYSYQSEGAGTLSVGPGGEKNYFWVSRAGNVSHVGIPDQPVWHGCSDWSYNNSIRKQAGRGSVSWANWSHYVAYTGNNGCYPMMVSDNVEPLKAYFFTDYKQYGGPGVMMNVWQPTDNTGNGSWAFDTSNLLNVDPNGTSGLRRFEPQMCPAKDGGVWVCYTAGSNIRIRYIPADIRSSSDMGSITEFPGARGAICADNKGDLHVVYSNAGIRYRKLRVSSVTVSTTRAGDYNGDGTDDIATYDPETFKWYINDGVETNKPVLAYGFTFGEPNSVPVVGNFNVSSRTDMAYFTPSSGKWTISNNMSYNTTTKYLGYNGVTAIPADYDGDGIDDLAVYDPSTGGWYAKSMNGKIIIWNDIWGGGSQVPIIGDYDGDGKADLALYNKDNGKWNIRQAQESYMRGKQFGYPGTTIVPGDYNGDGTNDMAVYDESNGFWYIKSVNGQSILRAEGWGGPGLKPVPGDYDGDGKDDLALYAEGSGKWYIKVAGINRVILWAENWGGPGLKPIPGDYDGDGKDDLALYSRANGLWYIKKVAGINRVILWAEGWGGPGLTPVSGDYDGDKKSDLALYYKNAGVWYIKKAEVKGDIIANALPWGGPGLSAISGDYNGDGTNDLAVCDVASGKWYIRNVENGPAIAWSSRIGNTYTGVPVSGDYNGDGADDLTMLDPASYKWDSKNAPNVILAGSQHGGSGLIAVPGDYDGDGKSDRAVWHEATGNWYVLKDVTNSRILWEHNFGLTEMQPVSGDFDGDGISDLNFWDTTYWSGWNLSGPSWYSRSTAPSNIHTIAWQLPFGGAEHSAIGSQDGQ